MLLIVLIACIAASTLGVVFWSLHSEYSILLSFLTPIGITTLLISIFGIDWNLSILLSMIGLLLLIIGAEMPDVFPYDIGQWMMIFGIAWLICGALMALYFSFSIEVTL